MNSILEKTYDPLGADWKLVERTPEIEFSPALTAAREVPWAHNVVERYMWNDRALEWYFDCTALGFDTLKQVVEVNPKRRGGVPILIGTRFTVAQTLAELADSSGVYEVAANFSLDVNLVIDLLNGLSLIYMRPIER